MLHLPNNCRAGKMSVYPKNWKTVRANADINWYICYRFYDDNLNKCKQVVIKGMNEYETPAEKRAVTQNLIDEEIDQIQRQGFNPITRTYSVVNEEVEISDYTPFIEALRYALDKVDCVQRTRDGIRLVVEHLEAGAKLLNFERKYIKDMRRREIKMLLEKCSKVNNWTASNYNYHRRYLSILYSQLLEYDAVDANYIRDISKKSSHKKIRATLTKEERVFINRHLSENYYSFWRFLHIFFHSGSRETELVNLRKKDVDLVNQKFTVTVKKGQQSREEFRTIKNSVLPLWKEVMKMAKGNDYLFSKGLVPGVKAIRPDQITKRWYRLIKKPFGITADFYSLKHSNLDETAEQLSVQDASKAAGHSSTVITMAHYLVGEKERQHNRLKKVNNSF